MDDVKQEIINSLREFLRPRQITELKSTPQFAEAVADIAAEYKMGHGLKWLLAHKSETLAAVKRQRTAN